MKVDAIVNAASEAPVYSYGVDTAVYNAAGEERLLKARGKSDILIRERRQLHQGLLFLQNILFMLSVLCMRITIRK